ncbi:alpha/beta hydrolase [Paucibacter sp. PLA-PC-4]|uniref:alpha/beta fold hydrolase n=1 Tax=Paucibacter sp. PLA-PC-4 TaxID=2993655 RepID=UPI0022489212|nr:alpha/beta hydrolase [Paucibacter sp. PLA-PC-4]MCX2863345.1 alpha/beta hydrolase [Paucibacter sp. PLA-PC-4]
MSSAASTLVLLPGLLCDDEVWAEQQAALYESCDIVIGRFGMLDRIEHMASHVLRTVAAQRFALAGHSMGGRVALEVLRQAPERVLGLALLDSGVAPLASNQAGDEERRGRHELLALAQREGMEVMARQWVAPMVHPDVWGTPLFERMVAMIARSDPDRFAAQINALLQRPDAEPVLRTLHCPLLLLCGQQDRWSPPDRHRAMQALVPGAALRIIEHCGHMSPMEQPQAVSGALVQWLMHCGHVR